MRETLLICGILSAVLVAGPVVAQTADAFAGQERPPGKSWFEPALDPLRGDDDSPALPPGPRHPHSKASGRGPDGVPPETILAVRLGVLETRIGIRAGQLDAWRDYTDALQQLLTPPRPVPIAPAEAPRSLADTNGDAFALEERLIDDAARRATAAEKLKTAIAALRTTLTAEQQIILASTELLPGPPAHPWKKDLPSKGPSGPRP